MSFRARSLGLGRLLEVCTVGFLIRFHDLVGRILGLCCGIAKVVD